MARENDRVDITTGNGQEVLAVLDGIEIRKNAGSWMAILKYREVGSRRIHLQVYHREDRVELQNVVDSAGNRKLLANDAELPF